jgi:hypothetical protein
VQTALLASLFELGGELVSAIDLHRANGERHAVLQSIEELSRGRGRGAGVGLNDVPARDHVAGGELFEDHTGQRTHVQGIDLQQVAGLPYPTRTVGVVFQRRQIQRIIAPLPAIEGWRDIPK